MEKAVPKPSVSKIRGIDSKDAQSWSWDGGADETRSLSVDIENNGQTVHDLGFLTACNLPSYQ